MKAFSLFLALLPFTLFGQQIKYAGGKFSLDREPPIAGAAGSAKKAYWKYYWEFGDGNYYQSSIGEKTVAYRYASPGTYTARVYLTPFYSYDPPISRKMEVAVTKTEVGNGSFSKPVFGNKLAAIATDCDNELIPGGSIQMVVHLKTPASNTAKNGAVVIGLTDRTLKKELGFAPLVFKPGNPEDCRLPTGFIASKGVPAQASVLESDNPLIFTATGLKPDKEYRIFFTIQANRSLKAALIDKKKKELLVPIKVLWLPEGEAFKPERHLATHHLKMLYIHDPNRIRVFPKAPYYKKNSPEEFTYTVQFQNEGEGAVRELEIAVPFAKNLAAQTIHGIETDPKCPVCPPGFNPETDTRAACYRLDTSKLREQEQISFHLYNIMLWGKETEDVRNKHTKGFVSYKVSSTNKRLDKTKAQAKITFLGAEQVVTRPVRSKWHYKTWGIKLGYGLYQKLDNYGIDSTGFLDRVSVGLGRFETPLKNGLGWGLELDYTPFRFSGSVANIPPLPNPSAAPSVTLTEEDLTARNLDLKVQLRYQLRGFFAVGAAAGVSAPIAARTKVHTRYYDAVAHRDYGVIAYDQLQQPYLVNGQAGTFEALAPAVPTIETTERATYGLFQSKQNAVVFDQEFISKRTLGVLTSLYLETGALGDFSIGYRQDVRWYPNFYQGKCLNIANGELYLRFKLLATK